jgi:hypothetical protein
MRDPGCDAGRRSYESVKSDQTARSSQRFSLRTSKWARNQSQGFIFSIGLGLFIFGFLLEMFGSYEYDYKNIIQDVVYQSSQVAGLIVMMAADVDANAYLRHRPQRVVAVFIMLLGYTAVHACTTPQPTSEVFWIQAIPLVYLLVRWKPIIKMKEGFPRFTELFVAFLVLDIAAVAAYELISLSNPSSDHSATSWVLPLHCGYRFFCILCNLTAYQLARRRGESLTLSLNAMLAVYNLLEGADYVIFESVIRNQEGSHVLTATWLAGPIHIIPGILLVLFRSSVHGKLGAHWLKQRMVQQVVELDPLELGTGDVLQVEEAIGAARNLNGFIDRHAALDGGPRDRFTLLMYASANNYVDAVELLLAQETVSVNMSSPLMGWSALTFACQNGHVEVAKKLIEQGANVNGTDVGGFSPLYIAALNGHVEVTQLLIDSGSYAADFNQEILVVCEAKGHHEIVELLIQEGAAKNTTAWMGLKSEAATEYRLGEEKALEMHELACSEARVDGHSAVGRSSLGSSTASSLSGSESEEMLSASLLYKK